MCSYMHITNIPDDPSLPSSILIAKTAMIVKNSGFRSCPSCPNIGWIDSKRMFCTDELECEACGNQWVDPTILPVTKVMLKLIFYYFLDNAKQIGAHINLLASNNWVHCTTPYTLDISEWEYVKSCPKCSKYSCRFWQLDTDEERDDRCRGYRDDLFGHVYYSPAKLAVVVLSVLVLFGKVTLGGVIGKTIWHILYYIAGVPSIFVTAAVVLFLRTCCS